jgi:hypothetical protein
MDLDALMRFLTFMSEVAPASTRPVRQPRAYSRLHL